MFGLGVPEMIFILLLALLIFGPKKLPEIGRTLGKGMSEFRKASNELTRSINAELSLDEDPTPAQPMRRTSPSPQSPQDTQPRAASPLIAAVPAPASLPPAPHQEETAPAEPVQTEAPPPPIEPA
ncbi:MAG TPA: TatA/E family twin arginine-targeting protein translocase [Thermoanaerobaculia bacterium]|jgi:sec-independent protein translocase protein TatA